MSNEVLLAAVSLIAVASTITIWSLIWMTFGTYLLFLVIKLKGESSTNWLNFRELRDERMLLISEDSPAEIRALGMVNFLKELC